MSKSLSSHKSSLSSKSSKNKIKTVNSTAVVRSHVRAVGMGLNRLKAVVRSKAVNNYFDVKDNKEIPTESSELKLAQYELEMLKGVARAAIGSTGLRTKIYVKVSSSAAAGAALALTQGIIPSASAEWASFQQLFDDYKVMAASVYYSFISSLAPGSTTVPSYCVAYDSTYASAPTSVISLMESDRHAIGQIDTTGFYLTTSHPSGGQNGFRHFHVKEPHSAIISPTSVTGGTGIVTNLPGSWIDMGDTQSTSSGYFKFYCEGSSTSVLTLYQFLEYDVMFRQRT